jgi:hypothetical protein
MGMFDTLRVQLKISGFTDVPDCDFQTKSLDSLMEHYVITDKGELYKEIWDYDWSEDPEHFLGGYERKIPESYRREYLTNYHGDIIFYTSKPMNNDRVWRDYTARFTDGKLSRIWYEDKQY